MLKKFLIAVCGTITGICIISFVAILVGAVAAGSLAVDKVATVNDNSILYINLSGDIAEHPQNPDFMTILQEGVSEAPTFEDILNSVKRAAADSKIKCIYLDCNGALMGVAQREELVAALKEFKKSGKPVYAYGDSYSQGDYLIASAADHLYMNPVGAVDVHGVGTTVPFFTGLLEKLGVKVQVIKVGSFKIAVEPYILKEMSDSSRLQTRQFVDTIWNYMAGSIAAERTVDKAAVNNWADSLIMTWTADATLESGAVTALKYRRQVEGELRSLTGRKAGEDLHLVSPRDYMKYYSGEYAGTNADHVALFFAEGDIVDSGNGGIAADRMVPQILALADDEHVKGMVFRVNSGGGSAFASEQIWEALEYFKSKNKALYVSMGDYAASGGYYISCGADRIYADRTTLTGSIGVFGMIPDFSGLISDKLGVTFSTVQSGPNAGFVSLTKAMTAEQKAAMQRFVENTYSTFVSRVSEGRGLTDEQVRRIAEGRVWVGSKAVELGLVDELGGMHKALSDMLKKCKLDSYDYRSYPASDNNIWQEILKQTEMLESGFAGFDSESVRVMMFTDYLKNQNPVQARMEPVEIQL